MTQPKPTDQPSPEYAAFDKAMRKAIAVPKTEIAKREAKWREDREAKAQGQVKQ